MTLLQRRFVDALPWEMTGHTTISSLGARATIERTAAATKHCHPVGPTHPSDGTKLLKPILSALTFYRCFDDENKELLHGPAR
jgi:hypothetical protein